MHPGEFLTQSHKHLTFEFPDVIWDTKVGNKPCSWRDDAKDLSVSDHVTQRSIKIL